MFSRISKYWRGILIGLLPVLPELWKGVKWLWDWFGRLDVVASHLHDLRGLETVFAYLTDPPPWSIFPSVGFAIAVILWDVRRQNRKAENAPTVAYDLNKKLLIGFYASCAAIVIGIWGMALALYFPKPPAPPRPVEAPKPMLPPLPPPKPPWLSPEEATLQQNKGRPLLIYSPQEIFAMLAEGQNINVFGDRWVKVAGATSSLPVLEKIQNKDFYRVELKLDGVRLSLGKVAAYFDQKKYGDTLLNIRPGGQLKAVCQLTKVDSKQPYPANSFYASVTEYTFAYYNCEPL